MALHALWLHVKACAERAVSDRILAACAFTAIFSTILSGGLPSSVYAVPAGPLNIVVFLTDDQRFDSLWAMPIVQDRLVSRGVTFTEAVVTTPFCCPFRASFLGGGYYAHNTGVVSNIEPNGGFSKFFDLNTLPVHLQQSAGYSTFLVGKYMNGYFYYANDQTPKYVPPGWSRWLGWSGGGPLDLGRLVMGASAGESATGLQLPGWVGHEADVFVDHTLEYLEAFPGPPRFVYFATTMPHYPATPAPADADLFPDYLYRGRGYAESDLSDKPQYVRNR
jgi:hypothetical protein